MNRHGWVKPLPSGAVARCGGPGMCGHCMAERLVAAGCPTETDRGGAGECFYCSGPNYAGSYGEADMKTDGVIRHKPDCPWPAFEKAFS